MSRWNLSVRAYERTLAVACSTADLDGAIDVVVHHVAEALPYRLQHPLRLANSRWGSYPLPGPPSWTQSVA
jgi:hypothetical protein